MFLTSTPVPLLGWRPVVVRGISGSSGFSYNRTSSPRCDRNRLISRPHANEQEPCLVYLWDTFIAPLWRTSTMRRTLFVVPVLGMAAVAVALAAWPVTHAPAEGAKTEVAAKAPSSPNLPVAEAVLFSSGVGFFQREGE